MSTGVDLDRLTAPLTHREIALILGISHGRVEQLEKRAIKKLRRILEARGASLPSMLYEPEPHYDTGVVYMRRSVGRRRLQP